MTSDPTLKRFYCWANREWFNGELPDATIYWEPTSRSVAQIFVLDGDERVIRLDPSMALHDCNWKLAVAHEQTHIKTNTVKHGKRFDAEIARLCTFKSYRKLL